MAASAASLLLPLVLAILAAYRVAYLVAMEDGPFDLADALRGWVMRTWPPQKQNNILIESWQARGINCPLCLSFWTALPAGAGAVGWSWDLPLVWLGIAGAILVIHKGLR
jgi:hypothetical protein